MAELRVPEGYHQTPAEPDLVEEAADHVRAVFIAESDRPFLTIEDYANFWTAPFMDLAEDLRLVRDDEGVLVAQAVVMNRGPYTDPSCFAAVTPDHYGRGLGSALLQSNAFGYSCRTRRVDNVREVIRPGRTFRVIVRQTCAKVLRIVQADDSPIEFR